MKRRCAAAIFEARLDQTNWSDVQLWNGGHLSADVAHPGVVGGEAAFAGRNFLGGTFIWGHAEATNAMQSPSPWNLPNLTLAFSRIAPIQAPDGSRQSMLGERGFLFGAIDGQAVCARIAGSITTGEFRHGNGDVVNVLDRRLHLVVDRAAKTRRPRRRLERTALRRDRGTPPVGRRVVSAPTWLTGPCRR